MAISHAPTKLFAVFAIRPKVDDEQMIYEPGEIEALLQNRPADVHVLPWEGEPITIDFGSRAAIEHVAKQLNDRVDEVEREDPWCKRVLGVSGLGEGLVFYPNMATFDSTLMFKAKGDKHRTAGKKALQVDATAAASIDDFVALVVTDARLRQGLDAVGGDFDAKKTGAFLGWISADVKKESVAELEASGLTWEQVEKGVSSARGSGSSEVACEPARSRREEGPSAGWLPDNLCYETIMGSVAYGVSSDTSDMDVYGICMPPKDMVFPHLAGEIMGFGTQIKRFEQWQEHHVAAMDKSWDFQILGIVKFFQLAMENNPNIIDSLFTPRRCVLSSTTIGEYLRDHRTDFLHKGAWHKFKGYAYSQLNKIRTKSPTGKRAELAAEHGYDSKFAYHVVRLLLEVEQILVARDIDLERDREQLDAIRRGEWPLEQLETWAQDKEKQLEAVYHTSTVPYAPDEQLIRRHLVHCLEAHYGDLSKVVGQPDGGSSATIASSLERYQSV
jgi:predicted nucleotidyltransferase